MFSGIEFLGKTISIYQICAIIGIFIAGIWACRMAAKKGLDDNDMIVVLLLCGVGAVIGSHLLYGMTQISYFSAFRQIGGVKDFFRVLYAIFGGSVFYGGLLGGALAGFLCIRKKRLALGIYSDILICAVPLFHFFGRLGCFFSGCCYGIPSEIGFIYHNAIVESANDVRRLPVQLLEAAVNFMLFFWLRHWLIRGKHAGKLVGYYLLLYPCCRFFLEFLRGDEYRGFLFGLSTSQWISLVLIICSVFLLRVKEKPISEA